MSIQVKWFATLVKRTKSKQPMTEVEWHEGITPFDVFAAEGFTQTDADVVMVLVNDAQSTMDATLAENDRLEFMVSIQGGSAASEPLMRDLR
ncbi:MAG: MoaD/ThiS family protein [Dehalococcoidia bacterium]|nr:MoaD/ThiS family protein [Dehalococcoidia bacterium]